ALVEIAAGHERRHDRAEIPGPDRVEIDVLLARLAVQHDVIVPAGSADGDDEGFRSAVHARQAPQLLGEIVEHRAAAGLGYGGTPQIEIGDEDAVLVEAGVKHEQVAQTADE